MPGGICGIFGKQRSGKTLFAYTLAKTIQQQMEQQGYFLRVYSNLYSEELGFKYFNSIDALPLDLEPKIVLIDEIYNGVDAQDWKKLKNISIWINTLGKQNVFLIFTSIEAGMIYNRLRSQMDLCVFVKGTTSTIYYRLLFASYENKQVDLKVDKTPELFKDVKYDSNFIPQEFDVSMKQWSIKLESFYRKYYPKIFI
jgi:uridine kinase|nr:ATP-binding protein [uncultured Lachnoclostridium sp.]